MSLSQDSGFRRDIDKGSEFLQKLLREEGVIYGVTTGYGDSCTTSIPLSLVDELPKHLYTFHGCGLGEILSVEQARAVLISRLCSLAKGFSGVSYELLCRIAQLLQHNIVPVIPQEGSVGASGDLTPLSYLAAVLCGERDVFYQGQRRSASEVFEELNIRPLSLRPKEGLAIMNGTAVMTGLACLAFARAKYLVKLTTRITSMMTIALKGNAHHFDEILFDTKPHPGQQQIAAWLRADLHTGAALRNPNRLQDRYSLRCAPHIIGVLQDSLVWSRGFIENELNSANDNPIIDGDGEHVLHGGHFYGGHIAFAMDGLKVAIANLADLVDRQIAQLVDTKFNHGLPANLSGANADRLNINHGLKAVQIGASAWTAEALKNTMPASVFSRSTECHNQDKVSMGTIAARDCLRVLELTEQVVAAGLLACTQGLELRIKQQECGQKQLSSRVRVTVDEVRQFSEHLVEDRALEIDLRKIINGIRDEKFSLIDME